MSGSTAMARTILLPVATGFRGRSPFVNQSHRWAICAGWLRQLIIPHVRRYHLGPRADCPRETPCPGGHQGPNLGPYRSPLLLHPSPPPVTYPRARRYAGSRLRYRSLSGRATRAPTLNSGLSLGALSRRAAHLSRSDPCHLIRIRGYCHHGNRPNPWADHLKPAANSTTSPLHPPLIPRRPILS